MIEKTLKTELRAGSALTMFGGDRWGARVRFAPEGSEGGDGDAGEAGGDEAAAAAAAAADADAGETEAGKSDDGAGGADENKADPVWWETIEDEKLRDYASKFTSLDAMAKNARDLRGKLSTAINPPGENATDDEIAEYREKIGVPASKDDYELPELEGFEQSDSDKAYQGTMAEVMHKHNIPNAAFKDLASAHVEYMQTQAAEAKAAQEKADTEHQNAAEAALRKDWGKEYAANIQYSDEGAKQYFDEDVGQLELKNGQLLGSYAPFIKGMAQIGRLHGEGVVHLDPSGDAAKSLTEKADAARAKREEARRRGDNAAALKYDAEEREILAKLG